MNSEAGSDLLLAEDLQCRRGGRLVCRVPRLAVSSAGLLWLRGPNGSGKTSLLRVLAGLSPSAGGRWLRQDAPRPLYIGHQNPLKEALDAWENLRFLACINELPQSPQHLEQALRHWGLWTRRHLPVGAYSQGMRRRLSLARLGLDLAAPQARLWLLDEPFDALDAEGVGLLGHSLLAHQQRGGATVLTCHTAWPQDGLRVDTLELQPVSRQGATAAVAATSDPVSA